MPQFQQSNFLVLNNKYMESDNIKIVMHLAINSPKIKILKMNKIYFKYFLIRILFLMPLIKKKIDQILK